MAYLLELLCGWGPYPLGGGIGGHELGVFLLELLELPEELVVLRVGYQGPVEDVVVIVVLADEVPELLDPAFYRLEVLRPHFLAHHCP